MPLPAPTIPSRILFPLLIPVLLTGCPADPSAESVAPPVKGVNDNDAPENSSPNDDQFANAERQGFDGLEFVIPQSWKKMELSQFQMGIISGKFQMPDAGPAVTVTLSRASGGLKANLDRWRGQFQSSRPEVNESIKVAGKDSNLIDLQGSFSPGFGKEANGEWRMMGIIVPLGQQSYFIKLTGPVAEVDDVEEDFRAFAASAATE